MSFNITSGYTSQLTQANTSKSKLSISSAGQNKYFKQWSQKFKNLKFYTGEYAFGKEGMGNITISKEQMTKLQNDPEKRKEFEKILKNCDEVSRQMASSGDSRLKKQGFFIDKEGEVQGWTVALNYASAETKYVVTLDVEQPNRWKSAMSTYTTAANPNYTNWSSRYGK